MAAEGEMESLTPEQEEEKAQWLSLCKSPPVTSVPAPSVASEDDVMFVTRRGFDITTSITPEERKRIMAGKPRFDPKDEPPISEQDEEWDITMSITPEQRRRMFPMKQETPPSVLVMTSGDEPPGVRPYLKPRSLLAETFASEAGDRNPQSKSWKEEVHGKIKS
jgi:hypothetical protein